MTYIIPKEQLLNGNLFQGSELGIALKKKDEELCMRGITHRYVQNLVNEHKETINWLQKGVTP